MIGWLDLSAGASGDMLLGALVDAGVPLEVPAAAVAALPVEQIRLETEQVTRHGLGATRVHVHAPDVARRTAPGPTSAPCSPTPRSPPAVRDGALAVFERLAVAEGRVHRMSPEDVHFHEVGALDALADVVGRGRRLRAPRADPADRLPRRARQRLGPQRARRRPDPRPGRAGTARRDPGASPAPCRPRCARRPAPRWWPHLVDEWTTLPPMRVERVGMGAGGRDPAELPNVVRLVLGDAGRAGAGRAPSSWRPTSTTWTRGCGPASWTRCSPPGASDAWLTPILMKKGRPAHTLSVLCRPEAVPVVQAAVFATTSTIGLRVVPVGKVAIERTQASVDGARRHRRREGGRPTAGGWST